MKKLIIFLICLILLMIGIVTFVFLKDSNSGDTGDNGEVVTDESNFAESIRIKDITIKEEARGVNRMVDATYPSIQSFIDKNLQDAINDEIARTVIAYRDEINAIVDDETPATNLYTYKTSYERYNNGDYLSLVVNNDYETGGIRTNHWKDMYNVNARTEKQISLKDIFESGFDFETKILSEINKQAKGKGYVLMNGEGLESLNKNQKFYIKDGELVIYFDPASIAPASYGELEFVMPFSIDL